jgi:hypothetical protein
MYPFHVTGGLFHERDQQPKQLVVALDNQEREVCLCCDGLVRA